MSKKEYIVKETKTCKTYCIWRRLYKKAGVSFYNTCLYAHVFNNHIKITKGHQSCNNGKWEKVKYYPLCNFAFRNGRIFQYATGGGLQRRFLKSPHSTYWLDKYQSKYLKRKINRIIRDNLLPKLKIKETLLEYNERIK